jgi:hypothetical protein
MKNTVVKTKPEAGAGGKTPQARLDEVSEQIEKLEDRIHRNSLDGIAVVQEVRDLSALREERERILQVLENWEALQYRKKLLSEAEKSEWIAGEVEAMSGAWIKEFESLSKIALENAKEFHKLATEIRGVMELPTPGTTVPPLLDEIMHSVNSVSTTGRRLTDAVQHKFKNGLKVDLKKLPQFFGPVQALEGSPEKFKEIAKINRRRAEKIEEKTK